MKQKNYSCVGVVLIALGLMATAQSAAAASVSFKGEAGGGVVGTPIEQTFNYAVDLTGTGKVSGLGKCAVFAAHITDGATGLITGGRISFVAKNGDTLTGTYTGQEFPTDSPNMGLVEATLTITGGSGRFRGASGTVPITAVVTIEEITPAGVFIETFHASFDATMTLPHPE